MPRHSLPFAPLAGLALLVGGLLLGPCLHGVGLRGMGIRGMGTSQAFASDDRSELEQRLDQLDAGDVRAAYALALDLEAAGAADLAAKAYEIVIGIDGEHRAARRALGFESLRGQWFAGDDLFRAKGFVRYESRWMTSEAFADATRPQREAAEQKAGEARVANLLLAIGSEDEATVARAKRRLHDLEDGFKLAPLARSLRCEPASLRTFAAGELARIADPLAVPALLKSSVYDKDESVRMASVAALKTIDSPSTLAPLGRALASSVPTVRVRAAQAIGALGDPAGVGLVAHRWIGRSGDFPRVYITQVNQVSYIQDFDVEVAQTSFIADPVVGVLQEGFVHSVKILAAEHTFTTYERPAYHGALVKMVGEDLGKQPGPWLAFWNKHKKRLLGEREERFASRDS